LSDEMSRRAPILVLGLGNSLLSDDGTGVRLVALLAEQAGRWGGEVELVDGGTQGLALLGLVADRRAIIILDAVALGAQPGTLHLLQGEAVLALGSRATSAHEGNAGELLRTARLLGDLPECLFLVGIEPGIIGTGIDLSGQVRTTIPAALQAANAHIARVVAGLQGCSPPEGCRP
jgi:hydrogenase maturation protease